ncbi:hypothetical protein LOC67_16165 [Stieleria sp. JC731]|nr:hypothetical protein [Stieleria sp. JC731]MCC9602097.1 hypothetical protein [Stieleria sp. JC731]
MCRRSLRQAPTKSNSSNRRSTGCLDLLEQTKAGIYSGVFVDTFGALIKRRQHSMSWPIATRGNLSGTISTPKPETLNDSADRFGHEVHGWIEAVEDYAHAQSLGRMTKSDLHFVQNHSLGPIPLRSVSVFSLDRMMSDYQWLDAELAAGTPSRCRQDSSRVSQWFETLDELRSEAEEISRGFRYAKTAS